MQEASDTAGSAAWLEEQIEACHLAYKAGVNVALDEALALCWERPDLTPRWVIVAVAKARRTTAKNDGPGRPSEYIVHFERWAHVKHCRKQQAAFRLNPGQEYSQSERRMSAKMLSPVTKHPKLRNAVASIGRIWDDAYEVASIILEGTRAGGTVLAMKKSYQFVEKEIKEGRGQKFFYPHNYLVIFGSDQAPK